MFETAAVSRRHAHRIYLARKAQGKADLGTGGTHRDLVTARRHAMPAASPRAYGGLVGDRGRPRADVGRDVLALHRLGSCVSAELLANLGSEHLTRSVIDAKVRRYVERLERDVLRAVDDDRFPPCAMRIVGRAFR